MHGSLVISPLLFSATFTSPFTGLSMTRKKQNKKAPSVMRNAMETPAVSSPTLAADAQKVIAPVAPKKSVWEKTLSEWITFFFKRWWALCLLVAETIFTNIVTQIHGNSAQLWIYLQQHFPIPVIAILLTAIAPFIAL